MSAATLQRDLFDLGSDLPAGMRYATPLGRGVDPGVMDWRDALSRLSAARYLVASAARFSAA